jgi:hypothetical protein
MRVDAEFDRFVLFGGVWGILGCHSLEIREISRDLKTSCHLATANRATARFGLGIPLRPLVLKGKFHV